MTSSIVLLLVLQAIWLVNSYDKSYNDLRRRTSDIFRGTLLDMRDSIFIKGFETAPDSTKSARNPMAVFFSLRSDTSKIKPGMKRRLHSMTEIVVRGAVTDSTRDVLSAFSRSSIQPDGNKFVVRFTPDSLNADTIAHYYKNALARENIDLPFEVKIDNSLVPVIDTEVIPGSMKVRKRFFEPLDVPYDKSVVVTEWIRFSPNTRYASLFDNVRSYLFIQISPQILFSVLLTLITATAFFMMYRSMRSQQRLMELKNDFISNITHELKTPVTTVSVALEALRNFKGLENPQTTREYLDIAQGELNRLTMLTDKVLKTAVLDNPGANFDREQVDLHKTVEQILHSMKLLFERQKAQVTFEQQGNSFTIHGGSVHLTNVVYNLLDNALKYGGDEPRISIRLEENEKSVILKVADKGIGIPSEYKKKIFEKFFRVPTGDIHNIKGYGLGLSYVDSVVKSHRGFIEVVSKPGEGSMFTILLPKE
jgi:two-component system, OmpR family, phosphate regulon sensor histidine kinase PhoR